MTDNVVPMFGDVLHDESPDVVLDKAKDWGIKNCLVIGETDDGEVVFGGSTSDSKTILWLLMMALWQMQGNHAPPAP